MSDWVFIQNFQDHSCEMDMIFIAVASGSVKSYWFHKADGLKDQRITRIPIV